MVTSARRWALMHEFKGAPEPPMDELIARMNPVDLLLIEGFKAHEHDKLEVFRREVGKPLLCLKDARVVAVASDGEVPEAGVPVIALDDVTAIADFVVGHCGLGDRRQGAA